MQRFEYRAPRFSVDLPARFTGQNSALIGRCREISKDGMILELGQPLPLNSRGTVSLSVQGRTIELLARVAHAGTTHSGLQMIYESAAQRNGMADLVASLAVPQYRPGPVLVR